MFRGGGEILSLWKMRVVPEWFLCACEALRLFHFKMTKCELFSLKQ